MKITCDKCSAKYSIADEKVKGKSFRLKCQKCSHSIVVKAGGGSVDGTDSEDDPENGWHIAIGQDQIGPLSMSEIETRWRRKDINADSFAWKDGMPDWKQMKELPAFSDLVGSDVGSTEVSSFHGDFSSSDDEATRVASRASIGQDAEVASVSANDDQPLVSIDSSLRDSSPEVGVGGGLGLSKTSPTENVASASSGFGSATVEKRNENSVLFSLSDIKQSGSSSHVSTSAAAGSGSKNSEDSGLLDIRAMASTLGSPASVRNRSGSRSSIELPSVGSIDSSFAPIAAAPVLFPSNSASDKPKWLLPALLSFGALVLIGVGLFAFMKLRPSSKDKAPIATVAPDDITDSGDPDNKGSVDPVDNDDKATGELAATSEPSEVQQVDDEKDKDRDVSSDVPSKKPAVATTSKKGKPKPPRRSPKKPKPTKSSRKPSVISKQPAPSKPDPVVTKKPVPRKPARKRDEIDDLISGDAYLERYEDVTTSLKYLVWQTCG